jgi:hypothetical protein
MGALVRIQDKQVERMEYKGFPVVALRQIDEVHSRPCGTADRTFRKNGKHFIDGQDFHKLDSSNHEFRGMKISNRGLILLTESGYLMIVKSFTDELSWKVQRELVNNYFRVKVPAVVPDETLRQEVQALRVELQEMKRLISKVAKPAKMKTHPVKPENRNFLYNRFWELYNGEMSLRCWKEITSCPVHNSVLATAFYQNMLPGERSLAIIMKHLKYSNSEIAAKLIELGIDKGLAGILA